MRYTHKKMFLKRFRGHDDDEKVNQILMLCVKGLNIYI